MSYESEVLSDTPALYYRLDTVGTATNGDPVPDSSVNNLDGTLVISGSAPVNPWGHVSPVESDPSSRAFFCHNDPGVSSAIITRASVAAIQPAGDVTLEVLLRPEVLGVDLVAKEKNFDGVCLKIAISTIGEFAGTLLDSAGTSWTVTAPSMGGGQSELLGTWWHVVLVRLGNALSIYVNKALRATTTITSGLPTLAEAGQFRIGAGISGDFHYYADEVALYTHALSPTRISVHYEAMFNDLLLTGQCNIRTSATLNGSAEPNPVAYPFRHNWTEPVVERLRWRSSVYEPTSGSAEFARQRSGLRRQVEYQHLLYSEELRRRFDARSFGGRKALVQFEPDKVRLGTALPAGATSVAGDFAYLDFEASHWALFYESDDKYEHRLLTSVTDSLLQWDEALANDYEPWTFVKPARVAQLPEEQESDLLTDIYADASVIYDYLPEDEPLAPRRIIPFVPSVTYRSREVFDLATWQGHDYSETPRIRFTSDRSLVDAETGTFSTKQYRWGARESRGYNMILQGRETIARYLGWLYARAGRFEPFWMPTFRQDLAPISRSGNVLQVKGNEYTDLYAGSSTRVDLAFVYADNTMQLRRIQQVGVSGDDDVLGLDAAVPTFTNLRWLSFLRRVTLDSDDLEIAWETDSVVRVAFGVTDAPLDWTTGSPSVSPSLSPSHSASTSPSPSASASVSPSGSASPSPSVSVSVSPSASTSPSASASPSA